MKRRSLVRILPLLSCVDMSKKKKKKEKSNKPHGRKHGIKLLLEISIRFCKFFVLKFFFLHKIDIRANHALEDRVGNWCSCIGFGLHRERSKRLYI